MRSMLTCEQTKGQSVYQHCMSVYRHFAELKTIKEPAEDWKIPDWFFKYNEQLLNNLHSEDIVSNYLTLHDVGKPACRTVDPDGKVHFPNHAEVSKRVFLEAGGDLITANLIGWDMAIHTASSEEIQRYLNIWTPQDACTLLLAALAEVHSNARLFGGIESISFKSKWKTIERRGNQICKYLFVERKTNV